MPGLLPNVDPDGLLEFSVVYTDRSLNHMSKSFGHVMTDISSMLKEVYHAHSAVLVPGSGTFGGDSNTAHLVTAEGVESWPTLCKRAVAERLAERIADAVEKAP